MTDIAIIGLLGRKGSGKSTVARYLVDRYGAQVVSFAAPLKMMAATLVLAWPWTTSAAPCGPNYTDMPTDTVEQCLALFANPEHKERLIPKLGVSSRWLLQKLGTEMCRDHIGANVWVNAALGSMQRTRVDSGQRLFVIDDVRFLNEVEMIRANNGVIIKLTCTNDPVPSIREHASEDVDSISAHLIDEAVASHRSPNSDHLLHEFSQALERMFSASVVDQARAAVRVALQSPRG